MQLDEPAVAVIGEGKATQASDAVTAKIKTGTAAFFDVKLKIMQDKLKAQDITKALDDAMKAANSEYDKQTSQQRKKTVVEQDSQSIVSALETAAVKMCLLAMTTLSRSKVLYKIGTVSIPAVHYRDVKELAEYQCNMLKDGKFASDLTFDLDRVTIRMRFKTESLIFFFAFDDYYFKRLGFEPYVLHLMN